MKTIEEISDTVAFKRGYPSIDKLLLSDKHFDAWQVIKEVATKYAKQYCDLQIKACYENSGDTTHGRDKSILNTPNVVEPIKN